MPQVNINENSANIAALVAGQASTHISAFLCGVSLYEKLVGGENPTPSYKQYNSVQELLAEFDSTVLAGTSSGFGGNGPGFTGGATVDRELHAALNYLEYGGILLAATGASALNRNDLAIDTVFCENNTKFDDVIRLVAMRQDCVGIVGTTFEYQNGSTGAYPVAYAGLGFTTISGIQGVTAYDDLFFSVLGRKTRTRMYGGATAPINMLLTSDAAGCFAKTDAINYPWFAPAGVNRGKLKYYVYLTPSLTDTDVTNLLANSFVNSFNTLVGSPGVFLLGDRTGESSDANKKQIGIARLVAYIKRSFRPLLDSVLFELNDAETRAKFVTGAVAIMEFVKAGRGVSSYSIICDESNNSATVVDNRQFVVDLSFKPNFSVSEITFRFTINQS
jgi:hypothetical protein